MEKIIKSKLTLSIFLMIVANDLVDTAAQLLMKKGLVHLDIFLVAGLILYASNFFLWMKVLSHIDLTIALPLASSSYILIPVAAIIFFHESISPLRWLGLALIVLGIYSISRSKEHGHD